MLRRRCWSLPWLVLPLLVAGSSAALVPQPGTQPGDLTVAFEPPKVCAQCHQYGAVQSPYQGWGGTMMANAARDPLMWAALAIAEQDVPEVGDMCLRCHTPVGWLEGRVTVGSPPPTKGQVLTAGDMEGVTCHLCHRMTEGPNGTPYLQNAQLQMADDDVRRGPYSYPAPGSAFTPPHNWAQSSFITSSELCGQCHVVTNPLVEWFDLQGNSHGMGFPIERTFVEWQSSDFAKPGGKTCQDCHMPSTPDERACSWGSAPKHAQVPRHEFAGGNAWMPEVIKGEFPDLQRGALFDATKQRALDMLQNKSATVSVTADGPVIAGQPATIRVRITNLTGHKLPTGYAEGRRMWIHVEANAGGAPLFQSGVYDGAIGDIVPDARLKVYEAQHGILGQGPTFHFVLNNTFYKDNRIPPAGFVPKPDTAPVGATFEVQPDGTLANWDDTLYEAVLPPGAAGNLSVAVTVFYQSTSREYVEFLRDANVTNNEGQRVYNLWKKYGMSPPVPMVSALLDAPIAPCVPSPEICNGEDDDCDGVVDEDIPAIACGVGACACTVPGCVGGQVPSCVPLAPSPEVCDNGVDEDCDGVADDGCPSTTASGAGGGGGASTSTGVGGAGGMGGAGGDAGGTTASSGEGGASSTTSTGVTGASTSSGSGASSTTSGGATSSGGADTTGAGGDAPHGGQDPEADGGCAFGGRPITGGAGLVIAAALTALCRRRARRARRAR